MKKLFQIPEDISALALEALQQFVDATSARIAEIGADPAQFVSEERSPAQLRAEMSEAVEALEEARGLIAEFESDEGADEGEDGDGDGADGEGEGEGDGAEAPDAEAALSEIAEMAASVAEPEVTVEPEALVAAAPVSKPRRRPARSVRSAPQETEAPSVSLVAAGGFNGLPAGAEFPSMLEVANAMVERRRSFGQIAEGDSDKIKIARATWGHLYPEERDIFGKDQETQERLVDAVVNPAIIRQNFEARRKNDAGSLVASGGLCAPVTPYYNLAMISVADRPVRAALPAFNADRGGLRYAQPASLAAITTGVGQMTVAQDLAGGTTGTKSCQAVSCPPFVETDVQILYHCLRFGNLGARTFPERVAQWNNLVLAAFARMAERALLTGIDAQSTAVTAASLGLGASADLLSQVLVAAAGMRSRHRMAADAVLRVMLPNWVLELLVSDVYRSQFNRFDMTRERFVALLRAGNVEPTFYIDSASGKNQEFGVQSAGVLLEFPSTVTWYLFPEGTFLYLDGGVLELGLVRDSVLNSTNDFEIFGESFENVANIGVESLAITSTLCDSGITAGTHNPTCPINYSMAT